MSLLPVSARLAWWGTAWLAGRAAVDDLIDAVLGDDVTHVVAAPDGPGQQLAGALGAWRAAGATAVGAAFPFEGDPVGLGGPPPFNRFALEAGEAVVVSGAGMGLVPSQVGPTVEWTLLPALPRQLPDVGETDRALRAALLHSANGLAALEVARWRPEVADRLMNLRHQRPLTAPPGTPARCVDLAVRALQAYEITELALEDDGGAITAAEAASRREAIMPLARAARHALTAACSPEVWPPEV